MLHDHELRLLLAFGLVLIAGCMTPPDGDSARFDVEEATIAQIHEAMQAGELTSRELVETYLARIEAYDKKGPALNAIVVVNPRALDENCRPIEVNAVGVEIWRHRYDRKTRLLTGERLLRGAVSVE